MDAVSAPKSTEDGAIAKISLKEKRVLVTNDEDFSEYPGNRIFAVIWLRIPQNEPQTLLNSFENMLGHVHKFEGRLVVLEPDKWSDFSLFKEIKG